eukprot:gene28110-31221_t
MQKEPDVRDMLSCVAQVFGIRQATIEAFTPETALNNLRKVAAEITINADSLKDYLSKAENLVKDMVECPAEYSDTITPQERQAFGVNAGSALTGSKFLKFLGRKENCVAHCKGTDINPPGPLKMDDLAMWKASAVFLQNVQLILLFGDLRTPEGLTADFRLNETLDLTHKIALTRKNKVQDALSQGSNIDSAPPHATKEQKCKIASHALAGTQTTSAEKINLERDLLTVNSASAPWASAPLGSAPSAFAPPGFAPSASEPSGSAPSASTVPGSAPTATAPSGSGPSAFAPPGFAPSASEPSGSALSASTVLGSAPTATAPSGSGPSGPDTKTIQDLFRLITDRGRLITDLGRLMTAQGFETTLQLHQMQQTLIGFSSMQPSVALSGGQCPGSRGQLPVSGSKPDLDVETVRGPKSDKKRTTSYKLVVAKYSAPPSQPQPLPELPFEVQEGWIIPGVTACTIPADGPPTGGSPALPWVMWYGRNMSGYSDVADVLEDWDKGLRLSDKNADTHQIRMLAPVWVLEHPSWQGTSDATKVSHRPWRQGDVARQKVFFFKTVVYFAHKLIVGASIVEGKLVLDYKEAMTLEDATTVLVEAIGNGGMSKLAKM